MHRDNDPKFQRHQYYSSSFPGGDPCSSSHFQTTPSILRRLCDSTRHFEKLAPETGHSFTFDSNLTTEKSLLQPLPYQIVSIRGRTNFFRCVLT